MSSVTVRRYRGQIYRLLLLVLLSLTAAFGLLPSLQSFAAPTADAVVSFTLINAATDQAVAAFDPLLDGSVIDLAVVGSSLNIRANTSPTTVGSVRFALDGNSNVQTENVAPYALKGDSNGNYNIWTPAVGTHTLTATPYSGANAGGAMGTALTVIFEVIDSDTGVTDPPSCQGLNPTPGSGTVSGTLTKWHPVTVSFSGPVADERDEAPNPFLDYRLQVTFTGPSGQVYVVPGYFAGDGSGGGSGDVWQARFSADEAGQWSYVASFRCGENVAVELDAVAGVAADFDGASGDFSVGPLNADAPGLLRWGRLTYVGGHYLKFADGPYWIKGGVDSPENLFGYADFDNTVDQGCNVANFVHQYQPHLADWQAGDPTWSNENGTDKGKGLIGAFNYLGSQAVNSVYFLPMNLGGDGCETYPFVGPSGSDFDNTHYDISKLHQWDIAMNHAQAQGIALHFVLNETESGNENWLDNGALGVERKLFYRELIARFGYVMAIKWNLSEENDFSSAKLLAFADYISALDWAQHQLTVHTKPNSFGLYDPLLGNANFDTTSIQYNPDQAGAHVETMRQRSIDAGRPWVIDMDENNPAGTGLTDSNADDLRKRVLYDVYFSGGNIEWYFGYHNLPLGGDLRTENFRTREEMYGYMRIARTFMQDNLPFWEMAPADDLLAGENGAFGGGEVFAKAGQVYAVYLPNASNAEAALDLTGAPGTFDLTWVNPRTGETISVNERAAERVEAAAHSSMIVSGDQIVLLGAPPSDPSEDWIYLLKKRDEAPAVSLGYFRAERVADRDDDMVSFTWETVTESDTAGFNLYAQLDDGAQSLITLQMVPSTVVDSTQPVRYTLFAVAPGGQFTLEMVKLSGQHTQYGPFSLGQSYGSPSLTDHINPLYLPIVAGQ